MSRVEMVLGLIAAAVALMLAGARPRASVERIESRLTEIEETLDEISANGGDS